MNLGESAGARLPLPHPGCPPPSIIESNESPKQIGGKQALFCFEMWSRSKSLQKEDLPLLAASETFRFKNISRWRLGRSLPHPPFPSYFP